MDQQHGHRHRDALRHIVSFGQAEVFDLYACPITYVMQDMENLGKTAVDILVKKMDNPKEKPREVLLDATLITRASSALKTSTTNARNKKPGKHKR